MTGVGAEVASPTPSALVARTSTRSVLVTSAAVAV
jgi:hypothetical protein